MDLIEIDCGNAQIIRARIPDPGLLSGEAVFEFDAADAIRVSEAEETIRNRNDGSA